MVTAEPHETQPDPVNVRVIIQGGAHTGLDVAYERAQVDASSHHDTTYEENDRKMEDPPPKFDAFQQKECIHDTQ